MKKRALIYILAVSLLLCACSVKNEPSLTSTPSEDSLIVYNKEGHLEYIPDTLGNTMQDFSTCGYRAGSVPLPNDIPVVFKLNPLPEDNLKQIQSAINALAEKPVQKNGFRGTILLTAGKYPIHGTLTIKTSGIVICGEGKKEGGTELIATQAKKHDLFQIGSKMKIIPLKKTRTAITDDYIPIGTTSFSVASITPFKVGDNIIVERPGSNNWLNMLGMNRLPSKNGKPVVQWTPEAFTYRYERKIQAIKGNHITIDTSIPQPLDSKWSRSYIYHFDDTQRIENIGIENLRITSRYNPKIFNNLNITKDTGRYYFSDEQHLRRVFVFQGVKNAWLRNITTLYIQNTAALTHNTKWITVSECENLDPVSRVVGARRNPFMINGNGQQHLFEYCYARRARHDFWIANGATGPNAFVHCLSEKGLQEIGPHGKYATGTLFDNIKATSILSHMAARNRGIGGAKLGNQGWSGIETVYWNCTAPFYILENPVAKDHRNFAIGCTLSGTDLSKSSTIQRLFKTKPDTFTKAPGFFGTGNYHSINHPVPISSLFEAQRRERYGSNTNTSKPDPVKWAASVKAYVDGIPYAQVENIPKYEVSDLLHIDDFNTNTWDQWQIETNSGQVHIQDNKLHVNSQTGTTLWFKPKLKAPVLIEYEISTRKTDNPEHLFANLNCFWMAHDPQNKTNLFALSEQRSGRLEDYINFKTYYVGKGIHQGTKTHFQRYTGTGNNPLLPEHDSYEGAYLVYPNKKFHIQLVAWNNIVQFYANGTLYFHYKDKAAYTSGWFGLQLSNNYVTIDNLKIHRLKEATHP